MDHMDFREIGKLVSEDSVNCGIKKTKCGGVKMYTPPHKHIEIHPGNECVNTPCFLRSLSR